MRRHRQPAHFRFHQLSLETVSFSSTGPTAALLSWKPHFTACSSSPTQTRLKKEEREIWRLPVPLLAVFSVFSLLRAATNQTDLLTLSERARPPRSSSSADPLFSLLSSLLPPPPPPLLLCSSCACLRSDPGSPKKCRARFGLNQQTDWCGPCRWVTGISTRH